MSDEMKAILEGGDTHAIAELLTGAPPTDEEVLEDAVEEESAPEVEEGDEVESEEEEDEVGLDEDPEDDEEDLDFDEDEGESEEEAVTFDDETTVELNGEDTTLGEIKAGYIRNTDYTKKTQELAAIKKEALESHNLAITYLSQDITKYETMLKDAENIDMVALANEDPRKFAQVQASVQQIQTKVKNETERVKTWITEQKAEEQAAKVAIWEETKIELAESVPNWNQKTASAISKYALEDLGMTKEALQNTLDAKLIIAIDKARRYDAARAKGKSMREGPRSKAAPKTIKSRSTKSGNTSSAKQHKALAAAQNSGDLREVARLTTEIQMGKRK